MARVTIEIFEPNVMIDDLLVGRTESEAHRMHHLFNSHKSFRSKRKKKKKSEYEAVRFLHVLILGAKTKWTIYRTKRIFVVPSFFLISPLAIEKEGLLVSDCRVTILK